jgi:Zn-dependent metalloprotease/tetratricopeptide (TPR) repeat protein
MPHINLSIYKFCPNINYNQIGGIMIVSNFIKTSLIFLFMIMHLIAQQNQDITDRHLARDNFKSKYGDVWDINWNSKTETPSTIMGGKITKYKGLSLDIAMAFLNEEKTMLGIKNVDNELLLTKENNSERGGTRYIFSQVVNRIPVIGSGYNVAVANDGSIYFISGDYYPSVNINTKPSLSSVSIIEIIKKDLNTIQNPKIENPELFILPEESNSEIKFRLVFVTTIFADKPLTALKYTIDANNGEIISKDELIDKINGTGLVFETNPNNGSLVPKTIHRLRNISPRKLDGDNAIVYNDEAEVASSSTATFIYQQTDTHFDEVMAYYHSDEFENWLIARRMPSNKVDKFEIYTHSDETYAGTISASRKMYLSDGEDYDGLRNPSHEAAVICHEYMHGVSQTYNTLDHTPGNQQEDAMDEAYSDFFAVSYSCQFFYSSIICSYIDEDGGYVWQRNLDNSWTMSDYNTIDLEPDSIVEEHDRSVIFSGALWIFRSNANVNATLADELILESLNNLDNSPNFLDGRNALIAADIELNDGCYVNIIKHAFYLKEIGSDAESVTTSGTLQSNETWYCTQTLQGNVTVPTGKTLTLSSVVTINLNGHSIISTGGTIIKESGAVINGLRARLDANTVLRGYCGRIQHAANYAGSDNEIVLTNGHFNENVSIYNKSDLRIIGTSQYYHHFNRLTLTACHYFQGLNFGSKSVYVNNSNYAMIHWVNAFGTDQSTIGFYFYNSDASVNNLLADYSQAGIHCYDGSEVDIDESWLSDNLRGIDSYCGSNVNVDNTYFCGTALDLKAYLFSSIEAYYCYYDGGIPSISSSSSTVYTYGNQSCSLPKVNTIQNMENNNSVISANAVNPTKSEFAKINSIYFDINKRLFNAFTTKTPFSKESYCNEYEKVIADFAEFIENNPDSSLSKIALIASARCYRRIDDLQGKSDAAGMKNYLTGIIENKEYTALIPSAERRMIDYYTTVNDYANAVIIADNLIEKYKSDDDYVCDVLYVKGLILLHNLNNSTEAEECFKTILRNYPDNPLIDLAVNELKYLGHTNEQIEIEKSIANKPEEFSISNIPNPFNPSTTIQYDLPEDVKVVLEVFDIQGQKVKTLVNGFKEAGYYEVIFDGSHLASGVYIYKIKAGDFSQAKRMLLIK